MARQLRSVFVIAASIIAVASCRGVQDAREVLRDMEHRLADAWVGGDRDAIDGFLSDGWIVIMSRVNGGRKHRYFVTCLGPEGPRIASMGVNELDVRRIGEVAVDGPSPPRTAA